MGFISFSLFDVDKLLVWVSKFNPGKILSSICNLGVDCWNRFRKWFFGLNFDAHMWAVDAFMLLMPFYTEQMERVVDDFCSETQESKLEDCLELDPSVNEFFDEEVYKRDEEGVMVLQRTSSRKHIKRVRAGMMQAAIKAVEKRITNRHTIFGDDMGKVDEAAVRATASDICGEFKINEHHTNVLVYAAAYLAMTPDQRSIDSVKLAYNPKSQARRTLVTAVRENKAVAGFKSLEDF
ncbi:ORF1 [Sweet clover necrotic mosaic virus]|nr:RNA-dependent RNA polymerase [Sweet clover necrotic mosaic virus]AAA47455.1 ORF1 [Sweet clover necrotic mosaic virus]